MGHGRKPRVKYEAIGFDERKKASKKGGGSSNIGTSFLLCIKSTSAIKLNRNEVDHVVWCIVHASTYILTSTGADSVLCNPSAHAIPQPPGEGLLSLITGQG